MKNRAFHCCALLLLVGHGVACAQTPPEATAGNLFSYNSAGSALTDVSNSSGQYARFTAMEDTTASNVSVYFNSLGGGTNTITIGLQADDGTGKPSGVFLGSGSINPAIGWNTVNFAGTALVTGQIYHVVVFATSGSASWRLLNGANPGIISSGYYDSSFARGSKSGSTFSTPANISTVPYHVGTSGTFQHGSVYSTAVWSNAGVTTTSAVPGQRFIFHTLETGNFLESVSLRLNIAATPPVNDLRVVLLDDFHQILGETTISASVFTSGTNNYTADFSSVIGLSDGTAYRLAIMSEGSVGSSVRWVYMTTESAAFEMASYQGAEGYAFSYLNRNLAGTGATIAGGDYVFSYTTTMIPEPGSVVLIGIGIGAILHSVRRKKSHQV